MFQSVDEVIAGLGTQKYLCNKNVATVVYLGTSLQKPLLVEGPAGVGKTELGKVLADSLGMELIRLQCYEGLDEAKALYEWEYAKQLLYTQILKDKIGEILQGAKTLQDAVDHVAKQDGVFFSDRFLLPRPLLRALLIGQAGGAVDRRDRQIGCRIRSVFAGSFERLSNHRAGDRHAQGQAYPPGRADQQQQPGGVRRAQAPLPASVSSIFPIAEREKEIIKLKVPECRRQARRRSGALAAPAAQARSEKDAEHQRNPRLGARADPAQYQGSRQRVGRANHVGADEVRSGHSQGAPGTEKLSGRETSPACRTPATRKIICISRLRAASAKIMEARVIEFANILRRNGIRVSLSENMDAFRALELIGIADPQLFRNALRTTLIKRAAIQSRSTNCSIISSSASARPSTPSTARSWKSSGCRRSSSRRCWNRSRNF